MVRRAAPVVLVVLVVLGTVVATAPSPVAGAGASSSDRAAPPAPIETPADTSRISLVSTTTEGGWRYDFYRNTAYVCAVSGFHTFTVATPVGTSATAVRPLLVHMHGGGIGYFRPDGTVASTAQKTEESAAEQRSSLQRGGLFDLVRASPSGFRMLAVSMCSHDIYAGTGLADPYNPNTKPDGSPRTVDGLWATKAAIQHTLQTRPSDDVVLHGGSAGSFGSFGMAWALQEQGLAPTAVVGDSGVLFRAWQTAQQDEPDCGRDAIAAQVVPQRLHPTIIDPANEPAELVATGRLTVPLMHVWSIGDPGQCGTQPMVCPVPGSPTLGSVDCVHEPLRRAIAADASGRSRSLRLCVDNPSRPGTCDRHVPSLGRGLVNTLGPEPADYLGEIMGWIEARLDDDGSAPPGDRSPTASFVTAARTDLLGSAGLRAVEADVDALVAGRSRTSYLRDLTTSDAWLEALVDGFYTDTLGRPGDDAGTAFWVGELRSGRRSVAQVAAAFYASEEYYRGIGGATPETWVTDLYGQILGRRPDPGGLAHWVEQIAIAGRGSVAVRMYQSAESARARVTALYRQLLGRSPDPAGLAFWSARVVRTGDLALAVDLASSAEYATRAEARFP